MASNTKIEWADHTVNFWMGCKPVSEGCEHCYARRFWGLHGIKPGERRQVSRRTIETTLRKAKPRDRVFVNSLSDFLDPDVPLDWRSGAAELMRTHPGLTFLVLTKRPENLSVMGVLFPTVERAHIWLGVTVENQRRYDERVRLLRDLDWPGKKFLSLEPLLGDIRLGLPGEAVYGIDLIIVGGESGPAARPMKPEWVRSIRDQCQGAGVPFFFKQWGAHNADGERVGKRVAGRLLDGRTWEELPGEERA